MQSVMIYFTADHHFGHENVLGYCERPFSSVGEMDEEMIGRWNDVVCRDDVVYHLGDFTLGGRDDAGYYFRRLNGIVRILGYSWHHDRHWLRNWYDVGHVDVWTANGHEVEVLKSMAVLEHDPPIVLCHYPLAEWDRKHYGAWHLHGHSHGNYKAPGKILDVGVDATGFYPLSLETVEQIMGEL